MGSGTKDIQGQATCGVCRDLPSREECFLAVGGEERPLCRLCWEQALLDVHRIARRLRSPETARFRLS
ncbi:MAG TPA: hypothetical protein VF950_13750 [Planctomycetota bacterium]